VDIVFVVMPFADLGRPAIGVSLLKSAAVQSGYSALVEYCNIQLADELGAELYQQISSSVPPDLVLTAQPSEVAAIFEAPLHYLLQPEHQHVRTVEWRGAPRTFFEIEWQERRIWGATAAMIVNLSRRLALVA